MLIYLVFISLVLFTLASMVSFVYMASLPVNFSNVSLSDVKSHKGILLKW